MGMPCSFIKNGGRLETKKEGIVKQLPYNEILELKWKKIQEDRKRKQE